MKPIFALILLFPLIANGQKHQCFDELPKSTKNLITRIVPELPKSTKKENVDCFLPLKEKDNHFQIIDSLNSLISDKEIEYLFSCKSCAAQLNAFILYLKRHSKQDNVAKIKQIVDFQMQYSVAWVWEDQILLLPFNRTCYKLLKRQLNIRYNSLEEQELNSLIGDTYLKKIGIQQ